MTLFQFLLAFGAPFGHFARGSKYRKLPVNLRIGSFVSAIIFITAAISVMEKGNFVAILNWPVLDPLLVWFFVSLFGFITLAKIMSKSKWERRIMTPISVATFLLCLIVAIGIL